MDEHATDGYFAARLVEDPRRGVLWRTLCDTVFKRYVSPDGVVLELGAGRADFINNIQAARRLALDVWDRFREHCEPGVETYVGRVSSLDFLDDESVDLVFASNLVEHLSADEARRMAREALRVLRPGGRLILLQPNFRTSYRRYFDDFTHVSIWTDVSLTDFLKAEGYEIERVVPRFLPLTVKSRLPIHPLLIRAYLRSPLKPMAGQMLVVGRRGEGPPPRS